jgi:leucyl-tRNA synthetase
MDNKNNDALVSKKANEYWQDVDLYIGGTEHATGHLIYSRFWNKFLFDLGLVVKNEPFKKLINQGMIQGRSNFVYRVQGTNKFVSFGKRKEYKTDSLHVDVNIVKNDILDDEAFKNWLPEYKNAEFILDDDEKYHCGSAVEKMSKSMFNVVNPDDIIETYGADTLRMYEMFLGPLEQAKPWDTSGIDGVHKFLKKTWNLFYNNGELNISDEKATKEELKILHKTIKKIQEDIENFSFNTSISAFMICVNELTSLKTNKREVLEPLLIILSPFAPHITEELWQNALGNKTSILLANFPKFIPEYLVEDNHKYPVQFNGKTRYMLDLPVNMNNQDIEKAVLENENSVKYLEGKTVRKVIVVPKRIINIVVS